MALKAFLIAGVVLFCHARLNCSQENDIVFESVNCVLRIIHLNYI